MRMEPDLKAIALEPASNAINRVIQLATVLKITKL